MTKIARILALVLAVAMVLCLTACGGKTPDNTVSRGNDVETLREFDMCGAEIKVACWWEPMPKADANTEEARLQYHQMEAAKQEYNFNIKEIVLDQRDIRTNFEASLMSGDIWADIIYMRAEQAIKWAQKGHLLDLTNLYPMDSKEYNQSMREFFTIDGKTYAFTYYEDNMDNCIAFNKEIFDRVGVDYPYQLVNDKKWTWDKFVETVQKTTIRDASTNKIQVYGYCATASLGGAEQFMYTAIGRQMIEVKDGKYVSNINDPEVIQFIDKVRTLNLMDGVYMVPQNASSAEPTEKFKSGRIAMYRWAMSGGPNGLRNMEDDWGVVPIPTMYEGQEYKFMNTTQNVQVMPAALAKNMDWADKVAYVYHQIYKSPYTDAEEADARRSMFETQLRDKQSAELVMYFTDNAPVILQNSVMIGSDDHWEKIDVPAKKALAGEDTIARAFASIASAHQAIVEEANKN